MSVNSEDCPLLDARRFARHDAHPNSAWSCSARRSPPTRGTKAATAAVLCRFGVPPDSSFLVNVGAGGDLLGISH